MDEKQEARLKELISKMLNAKEEPAESCTAEGGHKYKSIAHADGLEYFSWTYECEHCGDVFKHKQKRTGMDREIWDVFTNSAN